MSKWLDLLVNSIMNMLDGGMGNVCILSISGWLVGQIYWAVVYAGNQAAAQAGLTCGMQAADQADQTVVDQGFVRSRPLG